MPQKKTSKSPGVGATQQFFDKIKKYTPPKIDTEALRDTYRKNMDSFKQTQKASLEMLRNITQLRTQFTRSTVEDMRNHYSNLTSAKTLEERCQMHSDKMKEHIDNMICHRRDLSEVWSKSCSDIGTKLGKRFKEGLHETKTMVKKPAKKH